MTAGRIPSLTSDNPNFASRAAMATSHTATNPTPPPMAAPWIRPMTGTGSSLIAVNMRDIADASRRLSSLV